MYRLCRGCLHQHHACMRNGPASARMDLKVFNLTGPSCVQSPPWLAVTSAALLGCATKAWAGIGRPGAAWAVVALFAFSSLAAAASTTSAREHHSPHGVGLHAYLHAGGHEYQVVHAWHGGKPSRRPAPHGDPMVASNLLWSTYTCQLVSAGFGAGEAAPVFPSSSPFPPPSPTHPVPTQPPPLTCSRLAMVMMFAL